MESQSKTFNPQPEIRNPQSENPQSAIRNPQSAIPHSESFFEEKFGLTSSLYERLLSTALRRGGDFAEIFLQYRIAEQINLEEGLVKNPTRTVSKGAGLRVTWKDRTGYAYTDDLEAQHLLAAADTASHIAHTPHTFKVAIPPPARPVRDLYSVGAPALELSVPEKVDLLKRADAEARRYDPRVIEVRAVLLNEICIVTVINSQGVFVSDWRPLTRFFVFAIAQDQQSRQLGQKGGGGRVSADFFKRKTPEFYARDAARQAIVALNASPAPAGEMDVVLGPGWPGILLHEAVGHGLEADFNRKKTSAFAGLLGQRVAAPQCTVVDDGTIPQLRGSLNIDDEGAQSECTVLIENGILKGFMQDGLSARLTGAALTGNGRREDFQNIPLPRMTNTYMLAGASAPEEIIASVKKGLFASSFGGGQVDITNGKFVFSANEAYLIEDGKITTPVRGASLIGNGPDILKRVAAVGTDLQFDEGVGTCGKEGQSVPVGVGMPTVRISGMTIGGTNL
ncbi:MAG TPA: metallopeptidase TldD-related protein [Acidobacteriota bacterium]|jgi:TldD protein